MLPMFTIRKRNGDVVQFDALKIRHAITAAWTEVRGAPAFRDDEFIQMATHAVLDRVYVGPNDLGDVESLQDIVEQELMKLDLFDVAKAYILYRQKRTEERVRTKPDPKGISDYIQSSKYARYLPEMQRREVFDETVARDELMHLKRFAHIPGFREKIVGAFDLVRAKKVLPSMRSMQFGGAAIEANELRGYNCSASLIDRPRVFAEAIYLLLSGCGVGYSVQEAHVECLPPVRVLNRSAPVLHHVVQDTIEGWADSVDALVQNYLGGEGRIIEFSYHLIRPAGTPLKTSGGRAPGHLMLKCALEAVRGVLHGAQGRQLRPIECHRIMCHLADAVLSGGIRRSAMIALFSVEDGEMMNCKSDITWFEREPWFANANNSAVLHRDETTERQFRRLFKSTRSYGEPGMLFVSDYDHVTNPCAEIGLDPVLVRADRSKVTGWALCNLTEMNAAKFTCPEDFMGAAHAAALIGTMQASYTSFPYLGEVTEEIVRRDALLGIGMTGMQDAPEIACNPAYQRMVAEACVAWNRHYAELLGINPAARVTCIKPSGTTTLALGGCGSGIHPHHAPRYIRRVTADDLEVVFQAFRAVNPHMCVKKPDNKWVIEFPVEAPEGAKFKSDFGAIEFCEMVRSTQLNWVLPGTTRESEAPGLRHNVSNTITVKDGEWDAVADWIWANRADLTGISLLSDFGDTAYAFAPFEAVQSVEQQRRWDALVRDYKPVNYEAMFEAEDGTALTGEAACAGGACER